MRPSTMGFLPTLEDTFSYWLTSDGRDEFLSKVQEQIDLRIDDNTVDTAMNEETSSEVYDHLVKAVRIHGDSKEIVSEAIKFTTQMIVGRVQMQKRMHSMRSNPIRQQPRGSDDREKGSLEYTVQGNKSVYEKFLQNQNQFR